jgi:hypothetical protein
MPFDERFERFVMFCVALTLNALAEYVRPVPAVVVAPLETRPLKTASPPFESADNRNGPEMVDDAVEKKPFRPRTVEVAAPYEVNGKM